MFSRSIFSELLNLIRRDSFENSVRRHKADKFKKGFGCWEHLIAMLYAQLSSFGSLRDLETGFNKHARHHYHLGAKPIRKSTLADANKTRSTLPFEDLVQSLMSQMGRTTAGEIRELLYYLDSTPITLRGFGFDWTKETKTRKGQGLKVHIELADHLKIPTFLKMTPANVNDITVGQEMELRAGATYVFDKGYCDYNWWWKINSLGSKFVTRLKSNSSIEILSHREVSQEDAETILGDLEFVLKNRTPRGGKKIFYIERLRRITVKRPDGKVYILVTNDFAAPASVIGDLYRMRWQIELFFKWLKQNLKIKRFLGRTENAVKIQILTALIAYLLTAAYKKRTGATETLKQMFVGIRSTLFTRMAYEPHRERKHREMNSLQLGLDLCS
jgi:putative transposase